MNTPKPLVTRTQRLACACTAAVITITLFLSVAIGMTGESVGDLLAQAQIAPTVIAPHGIA